MDFQRNRLNSFPAALRLLLSTLPVATAFSQQITSPSNLQMGEVTVPYSYTLTATGGFPPYSWAAPGLASIGLTLNSSTGQISGTPTSAWGGSITVTVTDSHGGRGSRDCFLPIEDAGITTLSLPNVVIGSAYSATLQATRGITPYAGGVVSGLLPTGLTPDPSTGTISGTPGGSAGTNDITDSYRATASRPFTVSAVSGLSITTQALLKALTSGNGDRPFPPDSRPVPPFSQTLTASGGTPPYTWSVIAGSLPPGMTLSTSGTISGIPTATGTYAMTIQVVDSAAQTASKSFSLQVDEPLTLGTRWLYPNWAIVNQPYSLTLTASGATTPYTWSPSDPTNFNLGGLTLSASGVLSGTPATVGYFRAAVTVKSAGVPAGGIYGEECCRGQLDDEVVQLGVVDVLRFTITSLPKGMVGAYYWVYVTTSGGSSPTPILTVVGGALPDGLIVSSVPGVGVPSIGGQPTRAGTFNFSLRVTDTNLSNLSATASFSITILETLLITTTSLPKGTVNTAYSQTLAASGGQTPYVWSINSGSLPPGLAFDASTGAIGGTPSQAGTYSFVAGLTDSAGNVTSQSLSIKINPPGNILSASPSSLFFNTVAGGAAPSVQTVSVETTAAALGFTAAATSSANWLLVSPGNGTTPATLTLSVNPTRLAAGTYSGTVTVSAAGATNGSQQISVTLVVARAVPAGDFDRNGVPDLVWRNDVTGQILVWYMGGPEGASELSYAFLDPAGHVGWHVVAVADFDGNGVPDLVWQYDTTGQVVIWYMGGAGGTTVQNLLWADAGGHPGWRVVAAADFNGDGVPDLVWQNDSTAQILVWYMGGPGGATELSYAFLDPVGHPGWHVVAAADFDGNGVPDLVWMNDSTHEVLVWYMGGAGGATELSYAFVDPGGHHLGWYVAAAMDFDGNGVPDLVWQEETTRQVIIWYMGGAGGATVLNIVYADAAGHTGWSLAHNPGFPPDVP